jgi:hypothetical protein
LWVSALGQSLSESVYTIPKSLCFPDSVIPNPLQSRLPTFVNALA